MDLSILIVTYNSAGLIDELLTRVRLQLDACVDHLRAEVVLVDNRSSDDTVARVRQAHPWVKLIASPVNLGFAAGNNLAARHAQGEFLLLLNPDALPMPGAIAQGVALMRAHPAVGLGGGELLDNQGVPQPSGRMFPTLRDEFFTLSGLACRFPSNRLFARMDRRWADRSAPAEVDWIPGAFVYIRARAFQDLDGFDERFFMYYEEVDLCQRLKQQSWRVQYWPQIKASHIGGASARTVAQERISRSGSQLELWRMRSALLYYRKQHGGLATAALHTIELGWSWLRSLRNGMRGRAEAAQEHRAHMRQLRQAWAETHAGQVSPQTPW